MRVRKEGKGHFLTIKEGQVQDRGQEEVETTPAQFASPRPLTKGRGIRKVRYEAPLDGRKVQVDLY